MLRLKFHNYNTYINSRWSNIIEFFAIHQVFARSFFQVRFGYLSSILLGAIFKIQTMFIDQFAWNNWSEGVDDIYVR